MFDLAKGYYSVSTLYIFFYYFTYLKKIFLNIFISGSHRIYHLALVFLIMMMMIMMMMMMIMMMKMIIMLIMILTFISNHFVTLTHFNLLMLLPMFCL